MRITERLQTSSESGASIPSFSLEVFLPDSDLGIAKLKARIERFSALEAAFIAIAGRGDEAHVTRAIPLAQYSGKVMGIPALIYIAVSELKSPERLRGVLDALRHAGIRNLVIEEGAAAPQESNTSSTLSGALSGAAARDQSSQEQLVPGGAGGASQEALVGGNAASRSGAGAGRLTLLDALAIAKSYCRPNASTTSSSSSSLAASASASANYFCVGVPCRTHACLAHSPPSSSSLSPSASCCGAASTVAEMAAFQAAGAEFFIATQAYESDAFFSLRRSARACGVTVPIVPSLLLHHNKETTELLNRASGVPVTPALTALLDGKTTTSQLAQVGQELLYGTTSSSSSSSAQSPSPAAVQSPASADAHEPFPVIHLLTLNLEAPVKRLLGEIGLLGPSAPSRRRFPWRASADEARASEDVRPIFWANRPASYVERTASWGTFPSGRWRSSANNLQERAFESIHNSGNTSSAGSVTGTGSGGSTGPLLGLTDHHHASHSQSGQGSSAAAYGASDGGATTGLGLSVDGDSNNTPGGGAPDSLNSSFSSTTAAALGIADGTSSSSSPHQQAQQQQQQQLVATGLQPVASSTSLPSMSGDLLMGDGLTAEEKRAIWGECHASHSTVWEIFALYLEGKVPRLPWCEVPLLEETTPLTAALARLNRHGFLTINSQPRVNAASSDDAVHGWGGPGGYVYQKAYVECFASKAHLDALVEAVASRRHPSITYQGVDLQGNTITNCGSKAVSCLTWGVFPNREILQPTVVDADAFLYWAQEAFELWISAWASAYNEDSPSADVIYGIYGSYYLINVVDHDFINGDVFAVFEDAIRIMQAKEKASSSASAASASSNAMASASATCVVSQPPAGSGLPPRASVVGGSPLGRAVRTASSSQSSPVKERLGIATAAALSSSSSAGAGAASSNGGGGIFSIGLSLTSSPDASPSNSNSNAGGASSQEPPSWLLHPSQRVPSASSQSSSTGTGSTISAGGSNLLIATAGKVPQQAQPPSVPAPVVNHPTALAPRK